MDRIYERYSLVATVDPASVAAGNADSDVFRLEADEVAHFILLTGSLGASATADFSVYCSNASGGTYAQLSGSAITQLVKASNDNSQAIIEVRGRDLPATKNYVKARLTVGTAASLAAVVALKWKEESPPGNDANLSTVAQVKYL